MNTNDNEEGIIESDHVNMQVLTVEVCTTIAGLADWEPFVVYNTAINKQITQKYRIKRWKLTLICDWLIGSSCKQPHTQR